MSQWLDHMILIADTHHVLVTRVTLRRQQQKYSEKIIHYVTRDVLRTKTHSFT